MARTSKPRVGIDARMYGLEHAGIGRYVMNLVDRIAVQKHSFEPVFFLHPSYATRLPNPHQYQIIPSSAVHYSIAEQTLHLRTLQTAQLDLLHVPHFNVPILYNRPFVATIHDILWHKVRGGTVTTLPPWLYYLKYTGYISTVRHTVTAAKAIFVPSKYVKDDLQGNFKHIQPDKVHITYEGSVRPNAAVVSKESFHYGPYFIYIGSAYPHKNITIILQALEYLRRIGYESIKLILVSSRSVFLDRIQAEISDRHLNQNVVCAGYQTDEAVQRLLKHAVALIHPSKSEGFGLTGIEAMHAGTPVIASQAAALPEIYSDAAIYFDPDQSTQLAECMLDLLTHEDHRQTLIQKGKQRAERFSWESMVAETVDVYQKVLG